MRLPAAIAHYFWDTDAGQLDPLQYPRYVQERLFEYGDETALRWLRRTFRDEELRATLQQSRALSPRSATFWAFILHVDPDSLPCLTRSSPTPPDAIWPH